MSDKDNLSTDELLRCLGDWKAYYGTELEDRNEGKERRGQAYDQIRDLIKAGEQNQDAEKYKSKPISKTESLLAYLGSLAVVFDKNTTNDGAIFYDEEYQLIRKRIQELDAEVEIAEEQYMAIVMDLYDIIQNKKQYKEGYEQGRKDEKAERGGGVMEVTDKRGYGVYRICKSCGNNLGWRSAGSERIKPDTQDAEGGKDILEPKCVCCCKPAGEVAFHNHVGIYCQGCAVKWGLRKPDTDIKMKPRHSYDVKLKIKSWEKGKLKADKPSDEARKITAKVRRELGITDREFDALLQKLKEGKPSMETKEAIQDLDYLVSYMSDYQREKDEPDIENIKRLLRRAQPLSVGRRDVKNLAKRVSPNEYLEEQAERDILGWLTEIGVKVEAKDD